MGQNGKNNVAKITSQLTLVGRRTQMKQPISTKRVNRSTNRDIMITKMQKESPGDKVSPKTHKMTQILLKHYDHKILRDTKCQQTEKHPSIFYTRFFCTGLQGSWSERWGPPWTGGLSIAETQRANNHAHPPHTHSHNLERPVDLAVMFMDCGGKLEYPEKHRDGHR
ncbi:hypothetical protein GOODEAATRI_021089 [Goodea atripinnis]|uniref:Uncharacterized protein n=1 Tax=Goodea atripinnis TaxID=208336 RepID=A0ABV0PQT0_9TELE